MSQMTLQKLSLASVFSNMLYDKKKKTRKCRKSKENFLNKKKYPLLTGKLLKSY